MSGQDQNKGGIASFSIGLGKDGPQAVPIAPAPPFRVLIAGDFGLPAAGSALNITGLDAAEILQPNAPEFSVTADNLLGSHPAQLEEQVRFASLKDLRPATILKSFGFAKDLEAAGDDPDRLAASGQRYDKVAAALRAGQSLPAGDTPLPSYDERAPEPKTQVEGTDGLDSLFSMIDMSGGKEGPKDSGSLAKAAVDAFIQDTLREESGVAPAQPAVNASSPAASLQEAQSALFFDTGKLRAVSAELAQPETASERAGNRPAVGASSASGRS